MLAMDVPLAGRPPPGVRRWRGICRRKAAVATKLFALSTWMVTRRGHEASGQLGVVEGSALAAAECSLRRRE